MNLLGRNKQGVKIVIRDSYYREEGRVHFNYYRGYFNVTQKFTSQDIFDK